VRLLPVIRLSLFTEASTSPERQLEKITQYVRLGDHDLVPIDESDYDLDVSGAVSPFDRPGLGKWLSDDRLDAWDALCVAKLDRLTRSIFDFTSLITWLDAHGKALVCLDPMLDLSTPAGRAFAHVIVSFAQYEREVIGARVKDAHDKLVRDGRYTGGMVPFGYRPVKLDKNWGFEVDPEYGPLVAEMADRYLRYESLGSIARWLRDSGVPSPKNVIRQRNGKPLTITPWSAAAVRIVLSSPAVLGAVTNAKHEPLRDDQGVIVYRAPGLITRDVYEKIQARLAQNPVPVRVNSTPLLQVAFCANCGAPVHRTTTKSTTGGRYYDYSYYHCHNAHMLNGRCEAKRVKADDLEEAVFGKLLELVGDEELTEDRIVPGRDYSEEAAKILEQTQHLQREIGQARLKRQDYSELQARLDAANAELDRLASLEPIPARIEPVRLDKTFRQRWKELDMQGRNAYLRESEVVVYVEPWGEDDPHILTVPRPTSDQAYVLFGHGMRIVIDIGRLERLRQQARHA